MRLSFYGAAGEVTGSCYLVETDRARVLVDFGMHQGSIEAERRNRRFPPIDPEHLHAVVLTHAHLDHCGRLPLLPLHGYRGRIHCTPATAHLTDLILEDAANIQESDAERVNRRRARQDRDPVTALYTRADVEPVRHLLSTTEYDQPVEIAPGISVRFVDAGHILGSASVEMKVREAGQERTIAFSGDIGERGTPLLKDPTPIEHADIVLLESTYGDRDHRGREASVAELLDVFRTSIASGGKVLIPAFAIGRTQTLIYHLGELSRAGKLGPTSVYIDSPMAIETTTLYRKHRECFDEETWALINAGQTPLSFPNLHYARTGQESARLNDADGGVVVIAASGMCTGGRILHHLRHSLWKPETHVVFVGFQAEGTLGRRLVDGAKLVRVMGEPIAVKAQVHTVNGFSAHAGQSGLVAWAQAVNTPKPRVFLTHGETPARDALSRVLAQTLGWAPQHPQYCDSVEL
jgi:metallo-beta-lactamase family protein